MMAATSACDRVAAAGAAGGKGSGVSGAAGWATVPLEAAEPGDDAEAALPNIADMMFPKMLIAPP